MGTSPITRNTRTSTESPNRLYTDLKLDIEEIRLHLARLSYRQEFEAAHGWRPIERNAYLVELVDRSGASGWSELSVLEEPTYTEEFLEGELMVIERYLIPRIATGFTHPLEFNHLTAPIRGHRSAKAAIEMASWDLYARLHGIPVSKALINQVGLRDKVQAGVVISSYPEPARLQEVVLAKIKNGYRRIKLKAVPDRIVSQLEMLASTLPSEIPVGVDANGSLSENPAAISQLDRFGLYLIEQPLAPEDLARHASLTHALTTPIALDESVKSVADLDTLLALGARSPIINLKPSRLGGLASTMEAIYRTKEVGAKCFVGGMFETAIGRAHLLQLAASTYIDDLSDIAASANYFIEDLAEPMVLDNNGFIEIPQGPGIGREPFPEMLRLFKRFSLGQLS
jgi:O-succinylbenzoate synthase